MARRTCAGLGCATSAAWWRGEYMTAKLEKAAGMAARGLMADRYGAEREAQEAKTVVDGQRARART